MIPKTFSDNSYVVELPLSTWIVSGIGNFNVITKCE
jgi:hypothetical protein